MNGFDLLKRDKGLLFKNNPFSVPCVLSNGINTQNDLKCISNYIGIQLNSTGASTINDSSEATLNTDDVKIGRPQAGWIISFVPQNTKDTNTNTEMINFKIDYVMEDRTIGVYKLSLSLLKDNSENSNTTSQTLRSNGGL